MDRAQMGELREQPINALEKRWIEQSRERTGQHPTGISPPENIDRMKWARCLLR